MLISTAAGGDRPSYASVAPKHGLFTRAWLAALRENAGELL